MSIVTIIGARPQFIKSSVVSNALNRMGLNEVVVHTGQHFDNNMSDVFFKELSLSQPKYSLNIHSMSHGAMTGKMLMDIETLLVEEKPSMVLVYGDTNSTLAGALAASKLHIPIAHVEAGLRSYNRQMPEEINRILTDELSALLFCPTSQAVKNLEQEGFSQKPSTIVQTGDVMYDAILHFSSVSKLPTKINPDDKYILVTCHRAENTDCAARLKNIILALNEIHQSSDFKVIMPMHPRTQKKCIEHNIKPQFDLIDPVGYLEMIGLMQNATVIATDSGGLQKEAYFMSTPCITLRDETEWTELVDCGANQLVGASFQDIVDAVSTAINSTFIAKPGLYGDGDSAKRIVTSIKDYLEKH